MTDTSFSATTNFLIRGSDMLAKTPDFRLVGRDEELKKLSAVLMRQKANSVLLVGAGGVGCSALCMGLQASKELPDAPFDIVNKRMYWLDSDGLFSSGDSAKINENFQKIVGTLTRNPGSVLIIEDMKDFIEAARNNNCTHFINALTSGARTNKFQMILESRDDDLESVLKCHSDMRECYTMIDLEEPGAEPLKAIVSDASKNLEKHHGIKVSAEAMQTAIELTNKYRTRDMGLSRAQPERSLTLLDRALTSFRLDSHRKPPELAALEARLGNTNALINTGKGTSETEALRAALESDVKDTREKWETSQAEIKKLYKSQRDGEEAIRSLEDSLEEQRKKEAEVKKDIAAEEAPAAPASRMKSFASLTAKGGFESEAVRGILARITQFQTEVDRNKARFLELTKAYDEKLELGRDQVLAEFASISGISASKLNQDEKAKLLRLEDDLGERVFGQGDAVNRLSNAVITARVGRRKRDKPQASFLFMGPSGVGKTEIAKALSGVLLDDDAALTRFDMSEYMEKHAVAKMIGAPPGYEGFEAGGILTNAMRKNPYRILLFDEIEKAHPDVFNIFLQILSDGRLTDNVGRTVSFADSIIIMTTNTGQPFFLDQSISFDEAKKRANEELGKTYRSEFLNRFNGRENIVCFNRLEIDSIEKIVRREVSNLNKAYGDQGVTIRMPEEELKAFCAAKYDPAIGARGLPGFIESTIEPKIARTILENPDAQGEMLVRFDTKTNNFIIDPPKQVIAVSPPANQNSASASFRQAEKKGVAP